MMDGQTQKKEFTVYDLTVFSFLFGSLLICWSFGVLRTATLILSVAVVLLTVLVFVAFRARLRSSEDTLGTGRKFLHLMGGSALTLGSILFPSELPFLTLSLSGSYLVYEVFRWWMAKRQLWLSIALAFFGSPEEKSGRPFWEAILGMTAISLVLSLFNAEVALVAIVNLTFGDGVAGLLRERLGEEARSFSAWKGWCGSLAGLLAAGLVTLMLTGDASLLIPIVIGMVVERLPVPVDDNFTVPVSTALSAWLLSMRVLG